MNNLDSEKQETTEISNEGNDNEPQKTRKTSNLEKIRNFLTRNSERVEQRKLADEKVNQELERGNFKENIQPNQTTTEKATCKTSHEGSEEDWEDQAEDAESSPQIGRIVRHLLRLWRVGINARAECTLLDPYTGCLTICLTPSDELQRVAHSAT